MEIRLIIFGFIGLILIAHGTNSQLERANDKDWWEVGNFYQIYPRSFRDSNGDGIGDLKGIIEKVGYLSELGMSGVWLSPIFKSPMVDFGYDCSDYYSIQPEYGTTEDLVELIEKAKDLGIKIILDFVPNHTSDKHEWFIKSANKVAGYENYYIWHPGKFNNVTQKMDPPNNWVSVFRFSAWAWHNDRKEYYLHQFVKEQPDLNYREPKVVDEMKNVLKYWLSKGVGGFRVDAVPFLFEIPADANGNYPDEPLSGNCDDPDSFCYLTHIYTQDREETFDMVYQWRAVLDEYSKATGQPTKVMMTEAYTSLPNIMKFYGNDKQNGSHIPFNFELINELNKNSNARDVHNIINGWLSAVPAGRPSNWVMGNHDQKRLASRFSVNKVDLLNILIQTLPGIAVTYNGEEIAMTDVYISWNETVDPAGCNTNESVYNDYSRDPARTPFQWDSSTSSGFSSTTKTWLPVSPNYRVNNVAIQKLRTRSNLKTFKALVALRQSQIMQDGNFEPFVLNNDVYIYKREVLNKAAVVVILNFGQKTYNINLKGIYEGIPKHLKVITSSVQSRYIEGAIVTSNLIYAEANVGTVLYTSYV